MQESEDGTKFLTLLPSKTSFTTPNGKEIKLKLSSKEEIKGIIILFK